MDQTSAVPDHQKRSPSDPKAPVFIPPFRKNLNTETHKNCVPTAVAKVPVVVFVPPNKTKAASGSDYVKDSPQVSGDSPAITSSRCENDTNHTARKAEDQKAGTETVTLDQPENHTAVSSEPKGNPNPTLDNVWVLEPFTTLFTFLGSGNGEKVNSVMIGKHNVSASCNFETGKYLKYIYIIGTVKFLLIKMKCHVQTSINMEFVITLHENASKLTPSGHSHT